MLLAVEVLISLHVLAAVFWAGSTFALTRTGATSALALYRPQMWAAVLVVLTGLALWGMLHRGPMGPAEQALAAGAVAALIAAGVQGAGVGPALRKLGNAAETDQARVHARILVSHRIAAFFLAIAVVAMTVSRFM